MKSHEKADQGGFYYYIMYAFGTNALFQIGLKRLPYAQEITRKLPEKAASKRIRKKIGGDVENWSRTFGPYHGTIILDFP